VCETKSGDREFEGRKAVSWGRERQPDTPLSANAFGAGSAVSSRCQRVLALFNCSGWTVGLQALIMDSLCSSSSFL